MAAIVGALSATSPSRAADDLDLDTKLREVMAPFIPEIMETAQLMYGIGACERHFRAATVDFYIREYMTAPFHDDLAGAYTEETQKIYRELYTRGRADAAKLNFDATQCQRVANAGVAAVKKARAERQAALAEESSIP